MTHTTVTAAEMKALEKAANDNGLLYIQMMENAGRAAFAQLRRRLPGPARLLVAAGRGNNGGDGFVMARVAAKQGWQVQVLLAEGEPKTPDAITNFGSLRDLPVEILHDAASAAPADAVVDALYGTGFHGTLRPAGRAACDLMNRQHQNGALLLAVDLRAARRDLAGEWLSAPRPVRWLVLWGLLFACLIFGSYGTGYDAQAFLYGFSF